MLIGVIGVNHKSSPLPLRERCARGFERIFSQGYFSENGVFLTTCNRTELYFCARDLASMQQEILGELRSEIKRDFEHVLYSYFGEDCFYHLSRVISGIDSAIFGESDIQRQVKLAYENARREKMLSHELHYLFQKGLKIGKEMRTSFLLSKKEMPLPYVLQSIIECHQADLQNLSFLFVGNSSINRKLISFFYSRGCQNITLATRMQALHPQVKTVDWDVLEKWDNFNVVVCGTNHHEYVIKRPLPSIREILLFDLSVPRNINPNLGRHPNIQLYNIDQIGQIAQKKNSEKEISLCENVIEKIVARQMKLFKERKLAKWRYAVGL